MTLEAATSRTVADRIRLAKLVAILRLHRVDAAADVAAALVAGGIRVLELTFGVDGVPAALARLADTLPADVIVGAGTVTTTQQVHQAADAGVSFIVAPNLDLEVVSAALDAGLTAVPGVATATEALQARQAGAELVKLFPAGALGLPYFKALRGPLPDVPFVVTGGISRHDAGPWLDAGATAVGLGSDLVPPDPDPNLAMLTTAARESVAALAGGTR